MPLGTKVGLSPGDSVLDEDPTPSQKRGGGWEQSPQFSSHGYCGRTAGCIKTALPLARGRPWSSPHCARWGHSSPPQFLAHFYCGQTAGCIKMPLGTDVGLSPRDFVLDGDPVPLPKKGPILRFFAPQGRHIAPTG